MLYALNGFYSELDQLKLSSYPNDKMLLKPLVNPICPKISKASLKSVAKTIGKPKKTQKTKVLI